MLVAFVGPDKHTSRTIKEICAETGCLEFQSFHSFSEFNDYVKSSHGPGVVVLEYLLPIETGLMHLKKIHQAAPSCRVIFLTRIQVGPHIERAFRMGATDCLQVPVSNEILKDLILKRAISSQEDQRASATKQESPQ